MTLLKVNQILASSGISKNIEFKINTVNQY